MFQMNMGIRDNVYYWNIEYVYLTMHIKYYLKYFICVFDVFFSKLVVDIMHHYLFAQLYRASEWN